MANKLLDEFFTMVKSDDSSADPVWDVIKAYRTDDELDGSVSLCVQDEDDVFPPTVDKQAEPI